MSTSVFSSENAFADALTNGNYDDFNLENRVSLTLDDLPLDLLFRMDAARAEFVKARTTLAKLSEAEGPEAPWSKKQKRETASSW